MELGKILFINEKEAKSLLDMPTCVDLMEKSFIEYANGKVNNPVKLHLPLRPYIEGYMNSMPSYMKESNLCGIKLAGVWTHNRPIGMQSSLGVVTLFHPETGVCYSIMDGTFITNIRTGAVVGLQAKWLAKKGSKVVSVIGAGMQGFTAMQAINAALDTIEEVRLVDINPATVEKYIAKATKQYPSIRFVAYDSFQEAVKGSDIVVGSALAPKPLLPTATYDKGTTVISVSDPIDSPEWVKKTFAKMVSDFPECFITRMNQEGQWFAEQRGGTYTDMPVSMIDEKLGDIIIGKAKGRENDDQIIFSATVGMSMEDTICGEYIYQKATEKGVGRELDFLDVEGFRANR